MIQPIIILISLFSFNISIAQSFKFTPDMYEYSPNSLTGVYLCTPRHVEEGDCSDVDQEYYDRLARITLGSYEIGILYVNGEKTIAFKGPFSPGSSDRLISVLEQNPNVKILTLASQGGSEEESYKVAKYVTENNLDTWIPVRRLCLSACSVVFLSGNQKTLDGQLGLHMGKFFMQDPTLFRDFESAKKTVNIAVYESRVYLMKKVRLFLEWGISLSLIDAMLEIEGDYLIFTSLDEIFNFDSNVPKDQHIKSLDEMSKYAREQPVKNFDFQNYEPL